MHFLAKVSEDWGEYDYDYDNYEKFASSKSKKPGYDEGKSVKRKISKIDVAEKTRKVDIAIDDIISKVTGTAEKSREKLGEYAPKVKSKVARVVTTTTTTFKRIDERGDKYTSNLFKGGKLGESIIDVIISQPLLVVVVVCLVSGLIGVFGTFPEKINGMYIGGADIQDNIHAEFEINLPQDDPTKLTLDEIQKNFTTDIIILYVETDNAFNDEENWGYTNLTNIGILNQMSAIEEKFDYNKGDKGEIDGIAYCLSISTLIKEINSTPPRMEQAIRDEFGVYYDLTPRRDVSGNYSIPDQARVDQIITKAPIEPIKDLLFRDTNDDGTYDTGVIIMGIKKMSSPDQKELISRLSDEIKKN